MGYKPYTEQEWLPERQEHNTQNIINHQERISFIEGIGGIEFNAFRGANYNENGFYAFDALGNPVIVLKTVLNTLLPITFTTQEGKSKVTGINFLEGFYSSEEIDNKFYSKTETDAKYALKTDIPTPPDLTIYYTKTETNTLLNEKVNTQKTDENAETVTTITNDGLEIRLKTKSNAVSDESQLLIGYNGIFLFKNDEPFLATSPQHAVSKKYFDNEVWKLLPIGSQFSVYSATPATLPTNIPTGTSWVLSATVPVSAGGNVKIYTLT